MAQETRIRLEDALSDQRLQRLRSNLERIPTGDEFGETVTQAMWETFVPSAYSDKDTIPYEELLEEAQEAIGVTETEDRDERLPWWFTQFEWTVSEPGIDEFAITDVKTLGRLEDFSPSTVQFSPPSLVGPRNTVGLVEVLDAFARLNAELGIYVDRMEDRGEFDVPVFPDTVFQIEDGVVSTSGAFQEWFDALVGLCPPMNEELTGLLLANSNVMEQAARPVLPDEVVDRFERIGLINDDDRVLNEDYHEPLQTIVGMHGVFDLVIDDEHEHDILAPLEVAFYDGWATRADPDRVTRKWVNEAANRNSDDLNPEQEREFARAAFNTPLWLELSAPVFTTEGKYGDAERKNAIKDILKTRGIIHDNE